MKALTIVLAGAALCLGACRNNDIGNNTAVDDVALNDAALNDVAVNDGAAAPATTNGQAFVNAAAASDRFEIESSRLAATKAQSSAVKKFAEQMISVHSQSTAKLKSVLAGVTPTIAPDDTPNAEQQSALTSLQAVTGMDFDSAYSSAQVDAHQKTLDTLNAYAANGDNPKLQAFAREMIPIVSGHLNMAKALQ
ncbi:MAG: DUF4142 domain-containing protein [Pseudomonadota bacterium]